MSASSSKAQASTEFTLILGVSLVAITIIIILAQQQVALVQNQKDTSDTQNAILDLSAAAKEVYAQGEGSKKLVFIRLPNSYEPGNSYVGNKSIDIRVAGTDHIAIEDFNVHGYLPNTPGAHQVWVVSEGNRVRIGLAMMEMDRNRIYVIMPSDSSASQSFSVKNIWGRGINITSTASWYASDVSLGWSPHSFSLSPGDSEEITASFVSSPSSGGTYQGELSLTASDGAGSSETTSVPITVEVIRPEEEIPSEDTLGPIITLIYQDPVPAVKLKPLVILATATDSMTGNSTISGCILDADNSGNWKNMTPADGAYDSPTENAYYTYAGGFSLGGHTIRAACTDSAGNTGPTAYYYFNVSEADQLGPIVVEMQHSEYPTTLSNVSVWGVATDSYTGNSNLAGCNYKLDSGNWHALSASDGAWDSPTENFTASLGALTVGYHNVYYQCTDVIGNIGGVYNDTFGVVDVDLMLVLDRSGSMAWNVTNATNGAVNSTSSTGWSWVKNMTVAAKNGNTANLTVELRSSVANCLSSYEARINGVPVSNGSTNSTSSSYVALYSSINISSIEPPYTVSLWLKRNATSGCSAYTRLLSVQQLPAKMSAAQSAAKTFLEISGHATYAGLVSFSTTSNKDKSIAEMTPANLASLESAINGLSASGSTCIECGLDSAADELTSSRARPTANKVIVMLTDGVGNYAKDGSSCSTPSCGIAWSVAAAEYCRDRNITVYTIGFGDDVNDEELTDIALLTHGDYYFAPNVETLNDIFMNIGR